MKKILLIVSLCFILVFMSSCRSWRERVLAPPTELEIPEGSLVATCIVEDITHKYVFQNDGVYQYFINDVEQDEDALDHILEQAFLHSESVQNYLEDEYGSAGCNIEDYIEANDK